MDPNLNSKTIELNSTVFTILLCYFIQYTKKNSYLENVNFYLG